MKQMIKYAMIRVNLEAFKQESVNDSDVIYDGYNSEFNRLMAKICFKIYNQTRSTVTNYSSTEATNPADVRIEGGLINVYAYQNYDECISINPQNGVMKIGEDLAGM